MGLSLQPDNSLSLQPDNNGILQRYKAQLIVWGISIDFRQEQQRWHNLSGTDDLMAI